MAWKATLKKIWHFLWEEDSIYSWLANIVIAFILIKFVVYPLISLMLATPLPVVAVVSGSMEHRYAPVCDKYLSNGLCISYSDTHYDLCGHAATASSHVDFTTYWQQCGAWYELHNISKDQFSSYKFSGGFNTGDVMIVRGRAWTDVKKGDIIVWFARDGTPIIHRVVDISNQDGTLMLQTKGDHNADQIKVGQRSETAIGQQQYVGVAIARIPWLGNIKLYAARLVGWVASVL